MHRMLTSLIVSILMAAGVASAEDWPQFMGPRADGISKITGINKNWNQRPPEQLWSASMADRGYSGPAAAQGKLFVINRQGDNDVVQALDLNTGKLVWDFSYADPGGPNYGYARSTPAVDGDRVYTLSRHGHLHCLKVEDGSKVWSRNIREEFKAQMPSWQITASPIVEGDHLLVVTGGDGGILAALNKLNGETVWQGGGKELPGYVQPVIATINGRKQYILFAGHALISINPADGSVIWRYEWRTRHDVNAALPVVIGNHIFITSGYGRGCALLRITNDKPEKVWENKEVVAHFSSPVLVGRHIFANSDPTHLVSLDPQTGKALWREPNFGKGGLVVVDGVIIALDGNQGDAIMVRLNPAKYEEIGRFKPLGGQSWTAPIVADGKLIVRNQQQLAVYNLK